MFATFGHVYEAGSGGKPLWIACYADMACTFEFVLHFVKCGMVTVSSNQILIITMKIE